MNVNVEDYLKNIYNIKQESGKVTNNVLADKLKITPAAVSDMVSKLSKAGYITNKPYKGFELTKKGESAAINLIRKHRLWEVFLMNYLNYHWDKVHEDAENLEHASSDELIQRLDDFLGNPKYDPHGDPIPDKHGKFPKDDAIPLTDVKIGEIVTIKKVSDESSEILEYFSKLGLALNNTVMINGKINFDNSIEIKYKGKKIFLSEKISSKIYVSKN